MVDATTIKPRPDYATIAARYKDDRSLAEITEHYLLERSLAAQLKASSRAERARLYGDLYTTLFESLPHHPQHKRRAADPAYAEKQRGVLLRLVRPEDCFVEIGAGDCRVSILMAAHCRSTIGVDVTPAVLEERETPQNFRFLLTEGIKLDLPSGSVDFVYSNQLMEHLHPEDAEAQLREIHRVLKPGGQYFCITPSALTGPHDVSRYFDATANGFHLKEYTYRDLGALFAQVGFGRMQACITKGGVYAGRMPLGAALAIEASFRRLPQALRRRLRLNKGMSAVLGVALLARKA